MFHGDNDKFILIGYSFGSLLTFKLASLLESSGRDGSVVFIDGSPQFIQRISTSLLPDASDEMIQLIILLNCIRILKADEFPEQSALVLAQPTWETKLETFLKFAMTKSHYSESYGRKMLTSLINTLKMALNADKFEYTVLSSAVTLFKALNTSLKDVDNDYGLGQYSKNSVDVRSIEADHRSILSHDEVLEFLNSIV